ncbi:MAG: spermidine synthase, partial [Candidatus Omnitrophica bacterium]|nr:spermidine synthase [Candidatus Omnitrophota bacterium]
VLDGLIQLCTQYEFVYHEMLVHPAMMCHPMPKRILVIGGGDGGVLRELLKHPVEEIMLVDIDSEVIRVSKKYLPGLSQGAFSDSRVRVYNEDALMFVKKRKEYFDIIINDSTDAYGPSNALWSAVFYRDIREALRDNGIAAFQTAYFREEFAKKGRAAIRKTFANFTVHRAYVGCFPFDECSFSFASTKTDFHTVSTQGIERRFKKLHLKTGYYSPQMHFASQVIPEYYCV